MPEVVANWHKPLEPQHIKQPFIAHAHKNIGHGAACRHSTTAVTETLPLNHCIQIKQPSEDMFAQQI